MSQGIGVNRAPPNDSSLPRDSSVTMKLELVPLEKPLVSSPSPLRGKGKISALLDTAITLSMALRYAGSVLYWRVGRRINSANLWMVCGGFCAKYVRRVLFIETRRDWS